MDKMSTNNYLTFMFECAACDALKNVQPSVFQNIYVGDKPLEVANLDFTGVLNINLNKIQ